MCLIIRDYKKNAVAEEDVVVYKLLISRTTLEARLENTHGHITYFRTQEWDPEDYTYYTDLAKQLEAALANDAQWFTPYQFAPITIGETKTSEVVVEKAQSGGFIARSIHVGLHSFTSLKYARALRDADYFDEGILVECIIPKGSIYHIGDFVGDCDSAASDKLVYVKQVD
jgi:hypothetical protein